MSFNNEANFTIYNISKGDALAEVFMQIRIKDGDVKGVIKELADQYLEYDSSNPHANWVKDNL